MGRTLSVVLYGCDDSSMSRHQRGVAVMGTVKAMTLHSPAFELCAHSLYGSLKIFAWRCEQCVIALLLSKPASTLSEGASSVDI